MIWFTYIIQMEVEFKYLASLRGRLKVWGPSKRGHVEPASVLRHQHATHLIVLSNPNQQISWKRCERNRCLKWLNLEELPGFEAVTSHFQVYFSFWGKWSILHMPLVEKKSWRIKWATESSSGMNRPPLAQVEQVAFSPRYFSSWCI